MGPLSRATDEFVGPNSLSNKDSGHPWGIPFASGGKGSLMIFQMRVIPTRFGMSDKKQGFHARMNEPLYGSMMRMEIEGKYFTYHKDTPAYQYQIGGFSMTKGFFKCLYN